MGKILAIAALASLVTLSGCSVVRPVTKPVQRAINTAQQVHSAAGQVYRAGRAVSDLVNPLEHIYVATHTQADDAEPTLPAAWVYDPDSGRYLRVSGTVIEPAE